MNLRLGSETSEGATNTTRPENGLRTYPLEYGLLRSAQQGKINTEMENILGMEMLFHLQKRIYILNSLLEKTIILVGIYNQQFQNYLVLMVSLTSRV